MEINAIRNDEETWTIQKLENIQRNAKSLAVTVTEDEVLKMRERILDGELIPVIFAQERGYKENYQITVDNEIAGNITTTFDECESIWEIDIFVYEGSEGKGVAYQSLQKLIQQYDNRKWRARVLESNSNFIKIEKILLKLGFTTDEEKVPNAEGIPIQEYLL